MAATSQLLIDLSSEIVASSLADMEHKKNNKNSSSNSMSKSKSSDKNMGAKNQVYYAKLNNRCPPALMPMLTTIVNGSLKSKSTLLKTAREAGLFALPPSSLPPNCPPLSNMYLDPSAELLVVLYEALLGSRRVRGTSAIVELIKGQKANLQKTLAMKRKDGSENKFSERTKLPRFVRVNLLKITVEEAKEHFKKKLGLKFVPSISNSISNFLTIKPKTFTQDPIIPSLFILPPSTNLHTSPLVDSGALVLQDRSSCLTALALNPPHDAIVIDTCASPGNKTLHMASLMGGGKNAQKAVTGKITAFERDPLRLETLSRRIGEQGASSFVSARGADFLLSDVSSGGEFGDVTHALIDPSCSGSGLAALNKEGAEALASEYDNGSHAQNSEKVRMLAEAQVEIISHAMRLPKLKAVAYSTCSVYREENEDVVLEVLRRNPEFVVVEAVPDWPHRGLEGVEEFEEIAPLVCRATYEKDTTNGFFVARFERRGKGEGKGKKKKRQKVDAEEETNEEPTKKKKQKKTLNPCKNFAKKGFCKKGNKCMYDHVNAAVEDNFEFGRNDIDDIMAEFD